MLLETKGKTRKALWEGVILRLPQVCTTLEATQLTREIKEHLSLAKDIKARPTYREKRVPPKPEKGLCQACGLSHHGKQNMKAHMFAIRRQWLRSIGGKNTQAKHRDTILQRIPRMIAKSVQVRQAKMITKAGLSQDYVDTHGWEAARKEAIRLLANHGQKIRYWKKRGVDVSQLPRV